MNLPNQHADLSGEMAPRIEKAFGVNMGALMRTQARNGAGRIRVQRYRSDSAHA